MMQGTAILLFRTRKGDKCMLLASQVIGATLLEDRIMLVTRNDEPGEHGCVYPLEGETPEEAWGRFIQKMEWSS